MNNNNDLTKKRPSINCVRGGVVAMRKKWRLHKLYSKSQLVIVDKGGQMSNNLQFLRKSLMDFFREQDINVISDGIKCRIWK